MTNQEPAHQQSLVKLLECVHLSMLVTSNCVINDDPNAQPSDTTWRHDNAFECEIIKALIDVVSSGTSHECGSCKTCPLIQMQEKLQTLLEEHDKTCMSVKP